MAIKELYLRPLSSLAKVFPKRIYGKKTNEIHTTKNRRVSFQIACKLSGKPRRYPAGIAVLFKTNSNIAENLEEVWHRITKDSPSYSKQGSSEISRLPCLIL